MPSIELITECVAVPIFYCRCDNRCANFISKIYDATKGASEELKAFIDDAGAQGWSIGLLGNMCPYHHTKAREAEKRIVIMPGSGLVN